MESAKVLIPLKYRRLIMSTDIGYQNQEHIAGEPAGSQAKPIPPLNGNYTTSQVAVNKPDKKPKTNLKTNLKTHMEPDN